MGFHSKKSAYATLLKFLKVNNADMETYSALLELDKQGSLKNRRLALALDKINSIEVKLDSTLKKLK